MFVIERKNTHRTVFVIMSYSPRDPYSSVANKILSSIRDSNSDNRNAKLSRSYPNKHGQQVLLFEAVNALDSATITEISQNHHASISLAFPSVTVRVPHQVVVCANLQLLVVACLLLLSLACLRVSYRYYIDERVCDLSAWQ